MTAVYDEDFHLIPSNELELILEDDGVWVRHTDTNVACKELYQVEEDVTETVKRTISNVTYQVFLHRLDEKKNTETAGDKNQADDVLTNLTKRIEKLEHALRMR